MSKSLKSNFFKRLFYNWHVKLISLALAFILWKYVDSLNQEDKFFSVDLKVKNIPEGYMITSNLPGYVKVVIRGRAEDLSIIERSDIEAYIDLRNSYEAISEQQVKIVKKNLPRRVVIKDVNPSYVEVKLEKVKEKEVAIIPVVVGKPPEGYLFEDIDITPKAVKIVGPESLIDDIDSLYTTKIDINGKKSSFEKKVDIVVKSPKIKIVGNPKVKASIKISTKYVVKSLKNIKINYLNLNEIFKISEGDMDLQANIRVPYDMKDSISEGDISAFVDCSGIEKPGFYDLPVEVECKLKSAEVVRYEPESVHIKIDRVE